MGFYLLILFFLILFSFLSIMDYPYKKTINKTIFNLYLGTLFFLSFLRWETGTDWNSYLELYKNIINGQNIVNYKLFNFVEKAYAVLIIITKSIYNNYSFYLFCNALIIFFILRRILLKYSIYPIFSLYLSFTTSFGYIFFVPRQTIAILLCFYSVNYIIEKKKKKFVLVVFLAFLFHSSAIIFLISYYIFFIKISNQKIIKIILFSIFISLFMKPILAKILPLINFLPVIQYKLTSYLLNNYNDGGVSLNIKYILNLICSKGIILLIILKINKEIKNNSNLNGWINLYLIFVIVTIFSLSTSIVFTRIGMYFEIYEILIIPYLFKLKIDKFIKVIIFILMISFFNLRLLARLTGGYGSEYIPYKTILNKVGD